MARRKRQEAERKMSNENTRGQTERDEQVQRRESEWVGRMQRRSSGGRPETYLEDMKLDGAREDDTEGEGMERVHP